MKITMGIVLFGLGLVIANPELWAQKYPTREIEMVIGWSPGGGTDVIARIFASELQNVLKVPVTPINKAGASSTIAGEYVRKAAKDGYTIFAGSLGWTLGCATLADVPHQPLRDFTPIAKVASVPQCIFVKSESPYKTLEDFVDRAKKNPKSLSCGIPGAGSDAHLNVAVFRKAAGIDFNFVPFKGSADTVPAILGGHTDAGCGSLPVAIPFAAAKKVRILAITGNHRVKQFPDVPTFREKGYNETFFVNWTGVWVANGVPQNVMDILRSACEKAMQSKDYISKIEGQGGVVEQTTLEEYRKTVDQEMKVAEAIAKEIGLTTKK